MNLCNKSFSILFINEDLCEIDGNCVNKISLFACLYSHIHISGAVSFELAANLYSYPQMIFVYINSSVLSNGVASCSEINNG